MSVQFVGTEILVNTATASDQENPQITALSNGGFVVTWFDASQGVGGATGDASGFAIEAQVFTAGGAPTGSEILVNTATASDQFFPQITTLSNGGFVVTWWDSSHRVGGTTGDTSGFAIKAQVFTADGAPTGSEILVNTATANDQSFQQITALSKGGFVVAWSDNSQGVGGATGDASGSAVKAQVFTAGGAPTGSEILVNTATVSTQANPQITALSNGGFVVTWEDFSKGVGGATGDASDWAIKAQVFTAGGAPTGSEILVNTATASAQRSPQITALSNGGFVVTWSDDSQGVGGATGDADGSAVKAQVFAAGGIPVGSEILVNTATASGQFLPHITALSNGGFVVTWFDASQGVGGAPGDASGSAVKAQVFTADGAPTGSEILVNTATTSRQQDYQIAALSNGGFVVTWDDFSQSVGGATGDASGSAVKAQVFAAGGIPVGSEILVNTATASDQENGQIAALSNGGFVVAWSDNSRGVGGATGDASFTAIKAQVFAVTMSTNPVVDTAHSIVSGSISELPLVTGSGTIDYANGGNVTTPSGVVAFSDLDLGDRPTASIDTVHQTVSYQDASGHTYSLTAAQIAALKAAFSIAPEQGNTNTGKIDWTYKITDSTLDFVGVGESITVVTPIVIDDQHGGTVSQNVVVTINGANDAPVGLSNSATLNDRMTVTAPKVIDPDIQDIPTVTGASFGTKAAPISATGLTIINGRYGELFLYTDGSYSYLADPNLHPAPKGGAQDLLSYAQKLVTA